MKMLSAVPKTVPTLFADLPHGMTERAKKKIAYQITQGLAMKTLNVVLITAQISYVDHLQKMRLKVKSNRVFQTGLVHAMMTWSVAEELAMGSLGRKFAFLEAVSK